MPQSKDQNSNTDRATVLESTRGERDEHVPRVIVVSGMMLGLQVELGETAVTIGRASECELTLPHPSVSRQHCRIWREGGRYLVEDLGSTNRTYLNGKVVERAELSDGDQISIGSNAIKFFLGASVEACYHHELIDLAIYDSLTGFFNRRHFRGLLDEEAEKAGRSKPLALMMMDLDHFKRINDRHGHLVGDQVLAGIARVIRGHVAAGAPIGRLGGEEFAVALRATTLQAAAAIAETLRAAVEERAIDAREQCLPVTLSIGVAESRGEASAAELLRLADAQLYRAKQGGRNRVCS